MPRNPSRPMDSPATLWTDELGVLVMDFRPSFSGQLKEIIETTTLLGGPPQHRLGACLCSWCVSSSFLCTYTHLWSAS
ncbi:unnamed protein product [Linum trigynum]|uniref:Uncharacterized protein n=1 Tax=Linum trigynum TaxID=586398 RepID=A0AAV2CDR2_9ROSI